MKKIQESKTEPSGVTNEKLFKQKFGLEEYQKLSPRLRRLMERIDTLPLNREPVSHEQLEKALS